MDMIEQVPEQIVLRAFEGFSTGNTLATIAESVVRNPPEFHKIFTLLFPPLLHCSPESPLYESILYFLRRIMIRGCGWGNWRMSNYLRFELEIEGSRDHLGEFH